MNREDAGDAEGFDISHPEAGFGNEGECIRL